MRTAIYLCCLLAAYFGGGALLSGLMVPLISLSTNIPFAFTVIQLILNLVGAFIPLLVLYRVLVFIKSRSLVIPNTFRGPLLLFACVATIPAFLTFLGYGYFILKQQSGVSGIPLALVLVATGLLSIIPVLYCELKEFYSHIPGRETHRSST